MNSLSSSHPQLTLLRVQATTTLGPWLLTRLPLHLADIYIVLHWMLKEMVIVSSSTKPNSFI